METQKQTIQNLDIEKKNNFDAVHRLDYDLTNNDKSAYRHNC